MARIEIHISLVALGGHELPDGVLAVEDDVGQAAVLHHRGHHHGGELHWQDACKSRKVGLKFGKMNKKEKLKSGPGNVTKLDVKKK